MSFAPDSRLLCTHRTRRSWARKTQGAAGGKEKAVVFVSCLLKFTMTSSVAFAVSVVDGAMKVVSRAGVLAQSQRFIRSLLSKQGGDSLLEASPVFFLLLPRPSPLQCDGYLL